MNYEQKYKEALEWMRSVYDGLHGATKEDAEHYFPELKESEDEKIRKDITWCIKHSGIKSHKPINPHVTTTVKEALTWLEKQGEKATNINEEDYGIDGLYNAIKILEGTIGKVTGYQSDDGILEHKAAINAVKELYKKQGEQKPVDKVEPKFKVGDWCIDNEDGTIFQIVKVLDNTYRYKTNEGKEYSSTHYSLENDARLWTIQDAKDGDVLVDSLSGNNQITILYKCIELDTSIHAYCGWNGYNFRVTTDGTGYGTLSSTKYVHATKEQRDTLEKAMADAGYEWDAEKKVLKKIENEIEIPFGAKDSELQEVTYYIPKGFHAEIDDDKVVIKKGEKPTEWSEEDERHKNTIMRAIHGAGNITPIDGELAEKWLKSLRPQNM